MYSNLRNLQVTLFQELQWGFKPDFLIKKGNWEGGLFSLCKIDCITCTFRSLSSYRKRDNLPLFPILYRQADRQTVRLTQTHTHTHILTLIIIFYSKILLAASPLYQNQGGYKIDGEKGDPLWRGPLVWTTLY